MMTAYRLAPGNRRLARLKSPHRQIRVEFRQRDARAVGERVRRDARGADGDFVDASGLLGQWLIELVADGDFFRDDRLDVADDADDLCPFDGFRTGIGNPGAERLVAAEEAARHRLTDDEDLRRIERVAFIEKIRPLSTRVPTVSK